MKRETTGQQGRNRERTGGGGGGGGRERENKNTLKEEAKTSVYVITCNGMEQILCEMKALSGRA